MSPRRLSRNISRTNLAKVEEGSQRPRHAVECPRLVARDMSYHQSSNRVQVKHNHGLFKILFLQRYDWFHVILRVETWKSLPVLLSIWTIMIIIFAGFYVAVDRKDPGLECGLGESGAPIEFGPAFAFSLETCTTVGYGLPNSTNGFFNNCPSLQVVIYFQMTWSMMFNAFLFAFFYSRLAKCDARGAQVVLSNKAIVTMVDGQLRFQVRVYDVDAATPVIEAHIRMYAVTKSRPVPRPLRIIQPDDDRGATLFLSVPTVVTHHIDLYSILHPPRPTPVKPAGMLLRQADSATCSREDFICPVCGESYGTYERWRNHVKYQRIVEEKDDYPVKGTHLELDEKDFRPVTSQKLQPTRSIDELKEYFKDEISEIICVVEAIEPISSGTFAALHSYRVEDIVFDFGARFSPCVEAIKAKNEEFLRVDLDRFHGIDIDNETLAESPSTKQAMRSLRKEDGFFSAVRTAIRHPPTPKKTEQQSVFDISWWDHQSTNSDDREERKTNGGATPNGAGTPKLPAL